MTDHPHCSQPKRPSAKQLAYLRSLALRAGQTFTTPATSAQASREIDRLKRAGSDGNVAKQLDRRAIDTARRGDAASVRRSEITGYGASATWR